MSTTSNKPTDIAIPKPNDKLNNNDGSRVAFGDVTNRAKPHASSKDGKPKASKPASAVGVKPNIGKRVIPRKRDATGEQVYQKASIELPVEMDSKFLTLKSLKGGYGEVTKAIDAEAFTARTETNHDDETAQVENNSDPLVLAAKPKSKPPALTNDPFKEISQSPNQYETLDLETPKPVTSYQYSADFHDVDKRDADDEMCVTAYVQDMYEYFQDQEHRAAVDPQYMICQKEINTRMRAILIDWLALVCAKSKLSPEVFYLTVNILDRYLEIKKASKKNLQLIGTTALFIASKYEEIYHVPVDDLVYLCDKAYTSEQIFAMESRILKALNYQISIPYSYKFLLRFLNAGHAEKKMVHMSCYILELIALDIKFIEYLPSELAAAAVMISRRAIGRPAWSPTLLHYTKYTEEEIIPLARAMLNAAANLPPDLKSSKRKYSSERKQKVALMDLPKDL